MKRTLIAAAILATATGSAFAAPSSSGLFNVTAVGEQVGLEGWVQLFGTVKVSSSAGAVINNDQSVNATVTLKPQAQSFQIGAVTTTYNDGNFSVSGTGTNTSYDNTSFATSSTSGGTHTSTDVHSYQVQNASTGTSTSSFGHTINGSVSGDFNVAVDDGGTHTSTRPSHMHGSATSTSSVANSGYANGSANASLTANVNGSSSSSHDSSSAYGHVTTASDNSSHSSTSSYAKVTDSSRASGYSVDDTRTTVDETVTGHVTTVTDTQQAATLTANTGSNAATGVSGNLGINIAEGVDNAQANSVSLASVDVGNVFGSAQIFNTQQSSGTANIHNYNLNAAIGDNSLQSVTGNVGVNVASGVGNIQNNSLAGAVTTTNPGQALTTAMVATDNNAQSAVMNVNGQFQGTANLGANTFNGASGNIGVNIAGGAGNLQHNGLAIAALNSGH